MNLLGADNPTFLKVPGDKVFVAVGFAGMAVGISVIGQGK